jgi:hypothetical protein
MSLERVRTDILILGSAGAPGHREPDEHVLDAEVQRALLRSGAKAAI